MSKAELITVVRKRKDKDGNLQVEERRKVQASMIPKGFVKEPEPPKPRVE